MPKILHLVFLLLLYQTTYGKVIDNKIIPVSLEKIEDTIIKRELQSIINGNINTNLRTYKTKRHNDLVISKYKNNNWSFYIHFNSNFIKDANDRYSISCPADTSLINDIRYFHVKYMVTLSASSLTAINNEIHTAFAGQQITCTIKSYISDDKSRNYLHFHIENNRKELSYIFIIKDSEYHTTVVT